MIFDIDSVDTTVKLYERIIAPILFLLLFLNFDSNSILMKCVLIEIMRYGKLTPNTEYCYKVMVTEQKIKKERKKNEKNN